MCLQMEGRLMLETTGHRKIPLCVKARQREQGDNRISDKDKRSGTKQIINFPEDNVTSLIPKAEEHWKQTAGFIQDMM